MTTTIRKKRPLSSDPAKGQPTVNISARGHTARIIPRLFDELDEIIAYSYWQPTAVDGRIQFMPQLCNPFAGAGDDGECFVPAGLVDRIAAHLRTLGYRVEIERVPIRTPDKRALLESPTVEYGRRELMQSIVGHGYGQLLVYSPRESDWAPAIPKPPTSVSPASRR